MVVYKMLKSEVVVMLYYNESTFEKEFDINKVFSQPVKQVFSDLLASFLSDLSKSILKDKSAKAFPDLITFAYFSRKSNLQKFKGNELNLMGRRQFGRGVCLHIAPSNIAMNFAFSFVMGLMAGNVNIIRLPTKYFEQVDIFLKNFEYITRMEKYSTIKKSNFFFKSVRDSEKLTKLVSLTNCLVVWGGDQTVKHFKSFDKLSSCVEVYFSNRKSSLIIDSEYFLDLNDLEMSKFCSNFYNDTYLVDQNACSSASMLIWYGNQSSNDLAKKKFINDFLPFLKKEYLFKPTYNVEKILDLLRFCSISKSSLKIERIDSSLWFLKSDKSNDYSPKLGAFINKEISSLNNIRDLFRNNEQTLTYFGFTKEKTEEIFIFSNGTVDRIVPIGKALDMGFIWDGRNMVNTLSKIITM